MHAHPIYEGTVPGSHLCLFSTPNVRWIIKSLKIKGQFVPRCEHFPLGVEKNQFMLFREIIAVCSEIHQNT
jgi:hypothetical protein